MTKTFIILWLLSKGFFGMFTPVEIIFFGTKYKSLQLERSIDWKKITETKNNFTRNRYNR